MSNQVQINTVTLGIRVSDLKEAKSWYERVLGNRPSISPIPSILEYELTPGCWLQLIEHKDLNPGETTLRIGIPDISTEHQRLKKAGISPGEIIRIEGIIARCEFKDPDGNKVSLYELL